MITGQLALVAAALFTGAAFYIKWAEQPARLALDDRSLLAEWKPSYKAGFTMQASLAVAGFLLAAVTWMHGGHWLWLAGAVVLVANWPFTLLVIMPVNNRLMAVPPADAGPETRAMIMHWGKLHAVRTLLGATATVMMFVASLA
ncbi:MAG: DUF1772 domain-containing protein [Hyphomicrobium sp.]